MNYFLFGIYPYIAITVFVLGSILRFNSSQYGWTAKSSQLLDNRQFRFASNLFHISILLLVLVHIVGLLTPSSIYEHFVSHSTKQMLAVFMGGSFGVICFGSMMLLIFRRLTRPRILATSSRMDIAIVFTLFLALVLGVVSLPFSYQHHDGSNLASLATWTQHIVTFQSDPASIMENKQWIFKAHIFVGLTVFLLFPFSRLVHVLSFPIGYLFRSYTQIVRRKDH